MIAIWMITIDFYLNDFYWFLFEWLLLISSFLFYWFLFNFFKVYCTEFIDFIFLCCTILYCCIVLLHLFLFLFSPSSFTLLCHWKQSFCHLLTNPSEHLSVVLIDQIFKFSRLISVWLSFLSSSLPIKIENFVSVKKNPNSSHPVPVSPRFPYFWVYLAIK